MNKLTMKHLRIIDNEGLMSKHAPSPPPPSTHTEIPHLPLQTG